MSSRPGHRRIWLVAGAVLAVGALAISAPGWCATESKPGSKDTSGAVSGAAPKPSKPKAGAASKKAEPWDPAKAGEEYRLLEVELALAKNNEVYLVVDGARRELDLKMKATVVWSCPLELASGNPQDLADFTSRFRGPDSQLARLVTSKYLFEGAERTPDSILAIVGQVVKADPNSLQRDVPERFQISWGWNLVLEVRTDVVGRPASKFRNTRLSVLEAIRGPFGQTRLVVRMSPEQALTLYRAVTPGLTTVVLPSS
jgi:hypothetical protein